MLIFQIDLKKKKKDYLMCDINYSFTLWYSVSSLAWFMSNQETSFVTIGQRLLANPLR